MQTISCKFALLALAVLGCASCVPCRPSNPEEHSSDAVKSVVPRDAGNAQVFAAFLRESKMEVRVDGDTLVLGERRLTVREAESNADSIFSEYRVDLDGRTAMHVRFPARHPKPAPVILALFAILAREIAPVVQSPHLVRQDFDRTVMFHLPRVDGGAPAELWSADFVGRMSDRILNYLDSTSPYHMISIHARIEGGLVGEISCHIDGVEFPLLEKDLAALDWPGGSNYEFDFIASTALL